MKKLFFAAAVAAITLSSCGGGSGSLKTETDSLAYSIGVDMGTSLKQFDSTLNINVVAAAMRDVFKGDSKMAVDSAYAFIREYQTVRLPLKKKKESTEFLAKVEKDNKNIKKTESGILYEIITPGDETVKAINDGDQVKVLYTGSLKDGKEFDSAAMRGMDTVSFALNQVIPGWAEGIKLVGKGGKIKLWIPSELGYGEQGNRGIAPNEALVFDVELVDVTPAAPAAPEAK